MPKYDYIVWDFNGTILDDVDIGIECINVLLARYGCKTIDSRTEYYRIFGFPIEEYYRRAGFDFCKTPYDKLAHEWIAEYRRRENTAPVRAGAMELIRHFYAQGIPQAVISATEEKMLREQLSALRILSYFESAIGRGDIYAKDKIELAVKWFEERKPGRVLMLGDTEHDFETARAAGFDICLVEGGHQPRAQLERCGCPVLSDFEKVLELLND